MTVSNLVKLRVGEEEAVLGNIARLFNAEAISGLLGLRDRLEQAEDLSSWITGRYFPLSKRYGGGVYEACISAVERLGVSDLAVEFLVSSDQTINAAAYFNFNPDRPHFIILNAGLLERLGPEELRFVVGHELGHLVFGHARIQRVARHVYPEPEVTPPFLLVSLDFCQKLGELSCDRVGLVAAGGLEPALEAMFKLAAGVGMSFLRLTTRDYIEQTEALVARIPPGSGSESETHPLDPLRVKALSAFHRSRTWRNLMAGRPLNADRALDIEMEAVLAVLRRQPRSAAEWAEYEFLLAAGALMLSSDQELSDRGYDYLVNLLSAYCYYPPLFIYKALAEAGKGRRSLTRSAAFIRRHRPQRVRTLLGQLTSLMLRDNRIADGELKVLLDIAHRHLKVPLPEVVDTILNAVTEQYQPLA